MSTKPCFICEQERNASPETTVFSDPLWAAGISPGYDVPGWVVLRLRRHAENITSLDDAELATYGRRVRDLVAAVREATGAVATYQMVFGEANPHFHALITARTADVPADRRVGDLLKLRLERADHAKAVELLAAIRRNYEVEATR